MCKDVFRLKSHLMALSLIVGSTKIKLSYFGRGLGIGDEDV